MKNTQENGTAPSALKRREFLAFGSAAVLLPVAVGANPWGPPAGPREQDSPAPSAAGTASVGYWTGNADSADLGQEPCDPTVVSADRMRADTGLAGAEARLQFLDLVQAPRAFLRPTFEQIDATVDFRVPIKGRVQTIPVHAWYVRQSEMATTGMTVPVDDEGVKLLFERRDARPGVTERLLRQALTGRTPAADAPCRDRTHTKEVAFTNGTEPSRPKLRRGVYFIELGDMADRRVPDWHRYQFRAVSGAEGPRRLVQDSLLGLEPVDFDYAIVSIS